MGCFKKYAPKIKPVLARVHIKGIVMTHSSLGGWILLHTSGLSLLLPVSAVYLLSPPVFFPMGHEESWKTYHHHHCFRGLCLLVVAAVPSDDTVSIFFLENKLSHVSFDFFRSFTCQSTSETIVMYTRRRAQTKIDWQFLPIFDIFWSFSVMCVRGGPASHHICIKIQFAKKEKSKTSF